MRQVRSGSGNPLRSPRPVRRPGGRLVSLELGIIVAALAVMLGLAVFYSIYSGLLRWALLILLLIVGGWIAGKWLRTRTADATPLALDEPGPGMQRSSLRNLSRALRRGNRGLRYSQMYFAIHLRNAFLAKARSALGFQGSILELSRHPELLQTLGEDGELIQFVSWVTRLERSLADVLSSSREMFPGESSRFAERMERMLRRMEAWP
ncbi:MAG: hypothetical protein ACE5EW_04200 [Thermoplasmata archaeon]